MALKFLNNARQLVVTTGTSTIALTGTVPDGWQSLSAAGAVDGSKVPYELREGDEWENGILTISSSGTVGTRAVEQSSNSGSPINLLGGAVLTAVITEASLRDGAGIGSAPAVSIASASTVSLAATNDLFVSISGTTTITSFGSSSRSVWRIVYFEGALTLTHHATSLILPGGANIQTAAGDTAWMRSDASGNWHCIGYERADGSSLRPFTLATSVAASGNTAVDFTGIPSWAKKITVMVTGLSSNGTSPFAVQIGDSGGIETTSYASDVTVVTNAVTTSDVTTYFPLTGTVAASSVVTGKLDIDLLSGNNWVADGKSNRSDAAAVYLSCGVKSLSATLDRVRVTTAGGTDAFDAGAISVSYQ
jgi:hypothetical protein